MLLKKIKLKRFNRNLIIILEGLPCSGKTSIAKRLSQNLPATLIPELLNEKLKKDKRRINFYINDLIKSSNSYIDNVVIIDRYFLSTIAFEEAIKTLKKKKLITKHNLDSYDFHNFRAKQFYSFVIGRNIIRQVDIVFYLKVPAADSIKRQHRENKKFFKDKFNIWQDPKFLKEFQRFCLKNLKKYYSVSPIIINGRLTFDKIYAIVLNRLRQFGIM